MRRGLSVILFVLGGWVLMAEPVIAFVDFGPDVPAALPIVILLFLVMAAVPLGIAVALSPGDRRRELGLTILIAIGFAIFSAVCAAAIFMDPGFKQLAPLMPPMPKVAIAPIAGAANLVVVTAIGWFLYRKPGARGVTHL